MCPRNQLTFISNTSNKVAVVILHCFTAMNSAVYHENQNKKLYLELHIFNTYSSNSYLYC